MANSINYAQVFNSVLDEMFYVLPKTNWMENTLPGLKWNNGKYIQIPKLTTPGLGSMNGYKAPDGDLTLDYEEKYLQFYRGRNMTLGRYDVDMTNFALTVGNAMKVFLQGQVIPEVDKLRIAEAAKAAYRAGNVTYYTPDASTVLGKLLDDIAAVQDEIGEDKQLFIQIGTNVKNVIKKSSEISRYLATREMSVKGINLAVEAIDEHPLLGTPSAYMQTIFDLASDGLAKDAFAEKVNWIVCAKEAIDAVARPQITKVIDPDMNQDGEYWKIMFSIYHGVWPFDNKVKGIRMSVNSSVGTLYVASTAGEAAGDSVIKASATSGGAAYAIPEGFGLFYATHASTAPTVTQGTALTSSWVKLNSAEETLALTNGHKITVCLAALDSKLPVASGNATIVSGS